MTVFVSSLSYTGTIATDCNPKKRGSMSSIQSLIAQVFAQFQPHQDPKQKTANFLQMLKIRRVFEDQSILQHGLGLKG